MKKLLTISLLLLASFVARAQKESGGQTEAVKQKSPIELKTYAEYDYSYTSRHYGSLAAIGLFHINDYFDLKAGLNAATENTYAFDGRAIVKFPMRTGKLMLENRVSYQAAVRNLTNNLCAGLSLGYTMDHLTVSFGGYSRFYRPMEDSGHTGNVDYLNEPINIMWSIEGRLRKNSSIWNLGLRASNFDEFHIERGNQPIVTLSAHYSPAGNLRIFTEAYCEPAGIFHRAADFYKAGIRLGINYFIQK